MGVKEPGYDESFRGEGYVHPLVCDGGLMNLYIYQNLTNCTPSICTVYMSTISQ